MYLNYLNVLNSRVRDQITEQLKAASRYDSCLVFFNSVNGWQLSSTNPKLFLIFPYFCIKRELRVSAFNNTVCTAVDL